MKKTYSFDVFDTCLCRLCGNPYNVFDVLSFKVQEMMGESCNEHMRQMFVADRVKSGGRSLEEIYSHVAENYPLPCSVKEMIQLELETERDMLVPIASTRQLVDKLRRKGDVLFISDMYLPDEFLQEQLARHGFFREGDRLYVSNTVGAWKYDGTLFRLIHEREGIPFRRWYHYGDSHRSDVKMPRRLGIHARHLHYDYTHYEEQWRQKPAVGFQYHSVLAGISRATKMESLAPADLRYFSCDIAAPLMVSWCVRILEDACQQGIKRVYFCARDSHSHFLVAQKLTQSSEKYKDLTVKYLFISTQALADNLILDFFEQEGVASKNDKVAVVDSRGRGYFVDNINQLLVQGGYLPIHAYIIQLCHSYDPGQMTMLSNYPYTTVLHNLLYAHTQSPGTNAIEDIGWLLENILSLNYHSKTIGYQKIRNKIVPVFSTEHKEISGNNIKQLKKEHDVILQKYAMAYVKCGLTEYNDSILSFVVIPTLSEYTSAPWKDYLAFLTRVNIYKKKNTYVHNIFSLSFSKGGRWAIGCIYYSLPRPLAKFVAKLFSKLTK